LVTLDHAAHGDHRAARAQLLEPPRLDDRVDRLLLGRVDEPARVDHDDVGSLEIRRMPGALVDQLREVALAVDGVLVAAEGDEADVHVVASGVARTGMEGKLAVSPTAL